MILHPKKELVSTIFIFIFTFFTGFVYAQSTVIGKKIDDIQLEYNKGGKPNLENQMFGLGIITTLADGSEVLSRSLRGSQPYSEYIIEMEGARPVNARAASAMYYWVENCEDLKDSKVVIKIKREEDKDWLLIEEIPIICEGSPVVTLSKVDIKKQLNELAYWKTAPKVAVEPIETKVYIPRKNDTLLYSTEAPKNVAFLKEGDKFLVLKSHSTLPLRKAGMYQEYMQFGFTLEVYQESNSGKLNRVSTSSKELAFDINRPITITNFKAIPSGYAVCSPEMILFFDKNYKYEDHIVHAGEVNERIFIDIDQIGSTNDFALIMADTDPTSRNKRGVEVFSMLYNKSEKSFYEKSKISLSKTVEKNHDNILNSRYCRVASGADNQFTLFYKNSEEDARAVSWNVTLVKQGHLYFDESTYWKYEYDTRSRTGLRSLNVTNPKAVQAIYGTTNLAMTIYESNSDAVQFNMLATSQQEFDQSIVKKAVGEFSSGFASIYSPQSNGYTLMAESSTALSEKHDVEVIRVYDDKMKFKGQFRIGIPILAEIMKYGYKLDGDAGIVRNAEAPNGRQLLITEANRQGRRYVNKYDGGDEGPQIFSIRGGTGTSPFSSSVQHVAYPQIETDPAAFFLSHTYAEYIISDDGNTLYMMSPFAIIKCDLRDVVEYKTYSGSSKN